MEKAHKMQEKKKSISGRKTDKTGKPAIWQLRGRGFYAGNEKEEKNLQSVILDMVNRFGYLGILILIAVENVFPPIPSEVILTFGGFLTTCTRLHPAGVVLASTAGSLLGALVLYGAGTLVSPEGLAELLESRPMKLLGFRAEDAWKTIAWFQKKGQRAVLLGRCIPIIRSLISVPAGMAGMKMPGFLLYTIVGSTVWNLLLVGIGAAVGAAWEQAAEYVKLYADVVFLILMVEPYAFRHSIYIGRNTVKNNRMHEIMHDMQKICLQFSNKCAQIHLNK